MNMKVHEMYKRNVESHEGCYVPNTGEGQVKRKGLIREAN